MSSLNWTYTGRGFPIAGNAGTTAEEQIMGSFRVLLEVETPPGWLMIGNGESPEGRWLVRERDWEVAERHADPV
jgi:hypothetical protein